jgi:hypothetical protein
VYEAIRASNDIGDDTVGKLDETLKRFLDGFSVEAEKGLVG